MKDSEHNFEELQQLLKLKRHEVPPPGYFHNFSSNVIAGIRAEREVAAQARQVSGNWLTRLMSIFETRPGLVGGMATSLVLLLVGGVVVTDQSGSDSQNNIFTPNTIDSAQSSAPISQPSLSYASANSASSGGISISTNPAASLQPMSSLFGQPNPLFQPASFAPAQ
ncbi:MAG TPA: hypothetical protein VGO57_10095 [Verrucomicrobiae bacterium]|jgi:hypothetical protein